MSRQGKILHELPRLSRFWVPSGGIAMPGLDDGHLKLIRAGYMRQSHPGIFQMLPLGLRVQEKVEGLVAKQMGESLGQSLHHQFVCLEYLLTSNKN